jgi:hypothetical protein
VNFNFSCHDFLPFLRLRSIVQNVQAVQVVQTVEASEMRVVNCFREIF